MAKECDNLSVGVIIENDDKIALLKRAKFTIAIAPPAGHIDEHGSPEQAAINEVSEELGLIISLGGLLKTVIDGRNVSNRCRRIGGDYHKWWVYRTTDFSGTINPSQDETQGAGWYSRQEIQSLADCAKLLKEGKISEEEWCENPGLEVVWYDFMSELGYIE